MLLLTVTSFLALDNLGTVPNGTVQVSVHVGYEFLSCTGGSHTTGTGYEFAAMEDANAVYETHTFRFYHHGDDVPVGATVYLCSGWGSLPSVLVVDEG